MDDDYQTFLRHLFDHSESEEPWFLDLDTPDFVAPPETCARLATLLFQRSGTDLRRFSDRQVNEGLKYILDSACSDMAYEIREGDFPLERKLDLIRSIWHLYADCLAVRCPPVLGHLSEAGGSALNYICYMLWDVTALAWWPGADKEAAHAAILHLLERVLYLDNDACVESALHGLGHLHAKEPEAVEGIIDRYLACRPGLRPELARYAGAARTGAVL